MTTKDSVTGGVAGENREKMAANMARMEALTQRLIAALSHRHPARPELGGPGQDLFVKATTDYWAEMVKNPARIFEHQASYWTNTIKHVLEAQKVLMDKGLAAPADPTPMDRRFSHPLWRTHPFFNFVKQQYMMNAEAIRQAVDDIADMDPREKRKLSYFTQQIIDMMAPTNFLGTNPDALERAIQTDGESLVKGLENLVSDLETHGGEMVVRLADEKAFVVGQNIAASPGKVVFRNKMLELIQYAPTTETVHAVPIVMFPPWINKFYILDLKPENSLIRWIVDQGYTLFVVSWVNPDATYRDVGLGDYMADGYLAAIAAVKAITGQAQVNAIGYCIGGTTLAMTLALMKARGDRSVASATFFTTLTDFAEQGEFTPFLQDAFIDGIEREVTENGILRSFIMARTFSYLRANDLIYAPAIRSYMLGESPPAFDLLFWNGDGTNLPARMAIEYLRLLCQKNLFAADSVKFHDTALKLADVDVPVCLIACETDHIAAWKDSYRGAQGMGSRDKTFILSESGHIAGIVNPPSKQKYGHYTNPDMSLPADEWRAGATRHPESWWPRWEAWIRPRSGAQVAARQPGDSTYPALADAPGTYVTATPKV